MDRRLLRSTRQPGQLGFGRRQQIAKLVPHLPPAITEAMVKAPVAAGGRRESRSLVTLNDLEVGMVLEEDVLSGERNSPGAERRGNHRFIAGAITHYRRRRQSGRTHPCFGPGAGIKVTFMEKSKLLLVDDEPNLTSALVRSLDRSQFEIFTADSAQKGCMILAGNDIDVVVSDERMPGMTGSQFLTEVRKQWPNTIRMILSGQADLEAAVRAINEGEVYRFLLKPCHPKELQMTILQGLQQKKLVAQSRKLLQEHQKTQNLLEELEKANPGITKIEMDEDGAIMMDDRRQAHRRRAVAARRPRAGDGEGRRR